MNDLSHQFAAGTESGPVWIVAHFAFSGGDVPGHAAGLLAALLAAGHAPLAVSPAPGAFAEASLEQALSDPSHATPEVVVIYLPAFLPLPTRWRGVRARMRQLGQARRAAAAARRVVLLRNRQGGISRLLQSVFGRSIRRGCAARVEVAATRVAPTALAERICARLRERGEAEAAEAAAFAHIQRRQVVELRLSERHVMCALNRLAEDAGEARLLRERLLALQPLVRALAPREADEALRQRRLRPGPETSRAMRAALAPVAEDAGLNRIAAHLRAIGRPQRVWQQFVPGDRPAAWDGATPAAAVLRHLAGCKQPEDAALLAGLERPLPGSETGLSELEWVLMRALRLPVAAYDDLLAPWNSAALAARLRALLPPAEARPLAAVAEPEIEILGFTRNQTGLAQNFWMTARALELGGVSPQLASVDGAAGVLGTLPPGGAPPARRTLAPARILHLNADRIPQEIAARPPRGGEPQIGFLLWELDRLPESHLLAMEMLDEIWVPSRFLEEIYARHFDGPVRNMKKGIELPAPAPWEAPGAGVTRFVTCFDFHSSLARKNPAAAVRAFRAAFPRNRGDVELVVKTTPTQKRHWGDPEGQMDEIRAAAAEDGRISIIEAYLPLPELLGLIGSADGLISPHRAEGFGYFPAFALSLGVPVAATDYSGTTDFCTPETSFPVPWKATEVPEGPPILSTPGARWAEIDHDALTETLRIIAADPASARARAAAGRALIGSAYTLGAQSDRYCRRLEELGLVSAPAPQMEKIPASG